MQEAAHARESCRRASTRTARLSMTGLAYSLFVRYNLQPVEETGNGWRLHCLWALPSRRPFDNRLLAASAAGLTERQSHVTGRTPCPRSQLRQPAAKAHTRTMGALSNRGVRLASLFAFCLAVTLPAAADEIRLKDGKKLYGVIVAYEENMFKVKTDFGYVLVEKDKIASIIPAAPTASEAQPAKAPANAQLKAESAVAADGGSSPNNANSGKQNKKDKTEGKISAAAVKPELPANATSAAAVTPPALKGSVVTINTSLPTATAQPAPPKEPELPAIREDVQGNLYTNYTNGFRMYKAPSWQIMGDARSALPNAIVAMGTANESSLLVVGREKTKDPLESAATTVEKRLYDVYDNYHRVSLRKTVIGGSPAIEFRYRGKADEHDWSGTLVVISRNGDIFTILGMTYADSDLIQIEENVIAKAIASLSFDITDAKK